MSSTDPKEAHELGMDRRITRRDFLNGVATGAATTLVVMKNGEPAMAHQQTGAASRPGLSDYYPPGQQGLRGSHPGSFEVAHRARDGAYLQFPKIDVDTGETYDLVVVGAGFSGMAAAFFFRMRLARRNVFSSWTTTTMSAATRSGTSSTTTAGCSSVLAALWALRRTTRTAIKPSRSSRRSAFRSNVMKST